MATATDQTTALSGVQKRELKSLADGNGEHPIQPRTLAALARRGYIDDDAQVTEAGRNALKAKARNGGKSRRRRAPRAATTPDDVQANPFVQRLVAVVDEELADLDKQATAIAKQRANAERIRGALLK